MTDPRDVMRKAIGIKADKPIPENTPMETHIERPCRCNRCPDCGGRLPYWERFRKHWPHWNPYPYGPDHPGPYVIYA